MLGEVIILFAPANHRHTGLVHDDFRGQRVGRQLLERIVGLARERGLPVVMLETGTGDGMAEAHRLYTRYGFVSRGPFLDYPDSEWSAFFELRLDAEKAA